jgi:hypothetical protein
MWPDNETPEPAAWINFNAATSERNVSFVCESELASIPLWPEPPREQRKPLTDEHLAALCRQHWNRQSNILDHLTFARAIEKAHGIGGEHE